MLDLEKIKEYYIEKDYTLQQMADFFGMSASGMNKLLLRNDIHKPKNYKSKRTDPRKIIISKEEIIEYYINQNHSLIECGKHFNCSVAVFQRRLRELNIQKGLKRRSEITKKSNLKKYGVEWYTQSEASKDRYKNTCLKKYGVDNISRCSKIQKKREKTLNERYGVINPSQIEGFSEKMKNTCLEKYGIDDYNKLHFSDKTAKILSNKESFVSFLNNYQKPKLTFFELTDILDISYRSVENYIHKWGLEKMINIGPYKSKEEKQLENFLHDLGIKFSTSVRGKLSQNKELDIYCEKQKIAIEFNGTYWHSSLKKPKNYHQDKSKECEKQGIRLIHIYEYEWNDETKRKIINSLLKIAFGKVEQKIYARKCIIKQIDNKTAKEFNEKNHLQGHRNAQITYGLYHNDELVQLMSFSKTKYNRNLKDNNDWEIIRGCPGSNNIVIGGVSKLFSHFLKENNPNSVFSYCDYNKFDGKGYESLGMTFVGYTTPDMKWVLKGGKVINRNPNKHQSMKENAIGQIFGAGSKKYIYYN